MKKFNLAVLTLSLTLCCFSAEKKSLYKHLVGVNTEWAKYISEKGKYAREFSFDTERDLLRAHFSTVIHHLKKRSTRHLTEEQRKNRKEHLEVLREYAKAGAFPVNYDYACNKPCFIDEDGGICAVGQLLIESGNKEFAYFIAANTKYAFIKEMNYPELKGWQEESGFTMDEIALIQPSYGGWGGRRGNVGKNRLVLAYGSRFAGANMVAPVIKGSLEQYKRQYGWAAGLLFEHAYDNRHKTWQIGCMFSKEGYTHQLEGNFGAANGFGKLLVDYDILYLSTPVSILIGRTDEGYFRFGLNSDILLNAGSSGIYWGAASVDDFDQFRNTKNGFLSWRPQLVIGGGGYVDFGGGSTRKSWLIEPSLSLSLVPDKAKSDQSAYVPFTFGVNTGIGVAGSGKNTFKQQQRKKKRMERREKRRKEREEKKKKKEEKKAAKELEKELKKSIRPDEQ